MALALRNTSGTKVLSEWHKGSTALLNVLSDTKVATGTL